MPLPPPEARSTAVVTGASSGIGAEFARALAHRGHNVVLVARREERLRALARELSGVRAEVVTADLTREEDRDDLEAAVADLGLAVEVLVNSAGFGIYRPFVGTPRPDALRELRLLAEAPLDLSARWLPAMVARGRGAVVNVSSTSGFQALPGNAGYAAAKAHVLLHSEALHVEVGPAVTVTAVCPGPVRTEFQETSDPAFTSKVPRPLWVDVRRVAQDGLRAAEAGHRVVVPGNALVRAAFAPSRTVPRGASLAVTRWLMGRELQRG